MPHIIVCHRECQLLGINQPFAQCQRLTYTRYLPAPRSGCQPLLEVLHQICPFLHFQLQPSGECSMEYARLSKSLILLCMGGRCNSRRFLRGMRYSCCTCSNVHNEHQPSAASSSPWPSPSPSSSPASGLLQVIWPALSQSCCCVCKSVFCFCFC